MGLPKKWTAMGVICAGVTLSMAAALLALPHSTTVPEVHLPEADNGGASTSDMLRSLLTVKPHVKTEMIDVVKINREWEKQINSIELYPEMDREEAIANATGVSEIGYQLTELKKTEIDDGLTQYELVLGEKNENWENISVVSVFTALESLWETLVLHAEQDGRQAQLYIRRQNGMPIEFVCSRFSGPPELIYWSIASDRPYTGARDDFRWRQEQMPQRMSLKVYPNDSYKGTIAFYHVGPVTYDPKALEILKFIQAVMPKGYADYTTLAFDQPSEADPGFIKRAAFRAVVDYDGVYESEQEADILEPIFQIEGYYFVLGRDLLWVGEQLFGEGVMIEHGGLNDKTWGYNDITGTYSHFPGGTGDEYLGGSYQVLLDYVDHGETVTATIAWLIITVDDVLSVPMRDGTYKKFEMIKYGMDGWGTPTDPQALWNSLTTETPRAQVTLIKKPEGGYWFTGYRYLG